MTEEVHVKALGRWQARLHALTRAFALERPTAAAQVPHWTDLHQGLLKSVPVDPADQTLAGSPESFGVIQCVQRCGMWCWERACVCLWLCVFVCSCGWVWPFLARCLDCLPPPFPRPALLPQW